LRKQISPIYRFQNPSGIEHLLSKSGTSVFTNGVFDIVHPGHIHLLTEASKLGDILIVGINSDKSVKMIKGESRPINNEMSRANLLSSLVQVDAVVIFDEETPLNLITALNPNFLVKGGDYSVSEIVGHDFIVNNGGHVITIPTLKGFSTTSIIEKSQSL
jgi:D-beta-D-heptose 7-phosphate kinase/D-beta-D-heptose 1-phosphate adenosyltransferase